MSHVVSPKIPRVIAGGASVPALGLGTWEVRGAAAERLVEKAIEIGYRHIDTARMYGNETEVGRAIERSDVGRDEVFLTTKIWPDDFRRNDFRIALDESLDALRTEYVDLLLLHWPNPDVPLEETIEALNEARSEGRALHIGVSNFPTGLLARAELHSDQPLAVNQVEYHPYLDQDAVLEAVRQLGMALTAYSPLAHGRVPGDEVLRAIGRPHGKSAAQVALRWLVQQDAVIAIPRTTDPEHLRENLAIFDFELDEEEVDRIAGLARTDGRVIDPDELAPAWD